MSAQTSICPKCHTPLPRDAPRGLCPECLLRGGFASVGAPGATQPDETPRQRTIHIVVPVDEPAGGVPETLRYFGDYELLEEIAAGGMGVVFKARQVSLNRLVAVKMIRAGHLAREHDIRRFRIEAEAAANLKHPHIVAIHEVGEHEGRHFFSMDYIEGRSLAELVRDRPLEPARAARLVQTVAEAIAYAHGRGVLHRDLKPSNVMIDGQDEPHVTDFGLAKIVERQSELSVESRASDAPPSPGGEGRGEGERSPHRQAQASLNPQLRPHPQLTQTGAVLGSPSYMSPEQARGRGDQVSVRSDVYALGAILYELLTARPPFLAATPLDTLKLVAERDPVAPRFLNPSAPRDLETICLKCLQKEPAQRYANAEDLVADLHRFLRHEPIQARPSTLWERGVKWARRHPAWTAFTGLALAAPTLIIAVLTVMSAKVAQQRDRALKQQEITRQNLYAADIAVAFDALEKGDFVVANRALSAHAPASSEADLRGFEWRWLWQRAQGEARATFDAHLAPIFTVAWSPDGRWLASGGRDGVVQLWDAPRETLARTLVDSNRTELDARFRESLRLDLPPSLRRYSAVFDDFPQPVCVFSVSFSSDSRWLAVGGKTLGTQLWDPLTGELAATLPLPGAIAVFSPAQSNLLAGHRHYRSTNVVFLETPSGRLVAEWDRGVTAFAYSPDGQWAAEVRRSNPNIRVRHVPDGTLRNQWPYRGNFVERLAFSPEGRWLASGDEATGDVEIFEAHDGTLYARIEEQRGRNSSLAFSPDGRWLAVGNYDQTILLWDTVEKRETRRLRGHRSAVLSLAFSPDSQRLASGGHDGTVRFWDVAGPDTSSVSQDITNVAGVFAFSPDGQRLLTQSRAGRGFLATLWELPSQKILRSWPSGEFHDAVFNADGDIVTVAHDGSNAPPAIRIIPAAREGAVSPEADAASRISLSLEGVAAGCTSLGLSPDGRVCVTGHADGTVAFWDARTGRLQSAHPRQHRHSTETNRVFAVSRVAFSTDGRTVATVNDSGQMVLITWSMPEQREMGRRTFLATYDLVTAISPEGREIAVGGLQQGHTINFWNADLRASPRRLAGHQDFLLALAFAPDGRTLASGGRDGLVKLWHLPTGRELLTLFSQRHADKFGHIAFSPDGSWLGVADTNGRLRLWHGPAQKAAIR